MYTPFKKSLQVKKDINLQRNLHIELLAFVEAFKMVQQEFEISFKFGELCYTVMHKKKGGIIVYSEQASLSGPHNSLGTLFWLKTVIFDGSILSVIVISYQVLLFCSHIHHHNQHLDHLCFDYCRCGWKPFSPQLLSMMGSMTWSPGMKLQQEGMC